MPKGMKGMERNVKGMGSVKGMEEWGHTLISDSAEKPQSASATLRT